MTWLTPFTATDGTALTAAQLNQIRDNLMETAPAKATGSTSWPAHFATSGINQIAERQIRFDEITTLVTTTSTVYNDISGSVGPIAALTTGAWALVHFSAYLENDTAGETTRVAVGTSGATSNPPNDNQGIVFKAGATNGANFGRSHVWSGLTPGTNSFKCIPRISGGTGKLADREIIVMGL